MTQPMSEYSFKFFLFTFLLITCSTLCFAQQKETNKQTEEEPKKKKKEKLKLSSIRAGTEIIHIFSTAVGNDITGYEINADIGFNNKFFGVVDFGVENYIRNSQENNYEYKSNGFYYRVGFDYNLLYKKTANEALSFGLRYGISSFDHQLTYIDEDEFWGTSQEYTVNDAQLSGSWIEVVMAFKVELFKNIYLSPNLRLKFLSGKSDTQFVSIADIPGYGNTKSNTRVNISYTLLYKLPLGKKK